MSICAIILTNGRKDCFEQTYPSSQALRDQCDQTVIVDDSGEPEYRSWLSGFTGEIVIPVGSSSKGYYRAMGLVWEIARDWDYFLVLEDDFLIKKTPDVSDMIHTLEESPGILQLVLLRQAWFGNEIQAGGLIPALKARGEKVSSGSGGKTLEHRATWSTNPTLIRGGDWVRAHDWPQQEGSEYFFGQTLFTKYPGSVCAYWAKHEQDVTVTHIGIREGFGY